MALLPKERAAMAVEGFRASSSYAEVQEAVAAQIGEAIAAERKGLEVNLRLCLMVLDQLLTLPQVPGELRAATRACRGLCLAGLEGFLDE